MYEFDDGLGVDLVKDEEDRKMLGAMTEAEREQEFFKRSFDLIILEKFSSLIMSFMFYLGMNNVKHLKQDLK